MNELERCPRCGKTHGAMEYGDSSGMKFIVCSHGCLKEGPKRRTSTGAITAWNALPRALVWTTEPPKVEGNYWWMCEEEQIIRGWEPHPAIVHVRTFGGKFHFTFHYGNGPFFHCCDQCRWSGPIPEPQESRP